MESEKIYIVFNNKLKANITSPSLLRLGSNRAVEVLFRVDDFTGTSATINAMLPNREYKSELVSEQYQDGDGVLWFRWRVDSNYTTYKGDLAFSVEIAEADSDTTDEIDTSITFRSEVIVLHIDNAINGGTTASAITLTQYQELVIALQEKASLVDGKVPTSQLPTGYTIDEVKSLIDTLTTNLNNEIIRAKNQESVNATAITQAKAIHTQDNNNLMNNFNELSESVNEKVESAEAKAQEVYNTFGAIVPSEASETNQLADKNYVSTKVAENSSNFIGTFDTLADLQAYSGTLTNNDYAYVKKSDTELSRYKWNATEQVWKFERDESNYNFTTDNINALNSGITSEKVSQIDTNKSNIEALQTSYNAKKTIIENTTASYTTEEKTKLGSVEANANYYVLPTDVARTSDIPTKLSELTDDLGTSPTHTHSQYLTKTTYADVSVVGTTKNVYVIDGITTLYLPSGLVMGGTALQAGLTTRGICGCGTPSSNGSATKDNLYINYDGSNTYSTSRQVVLQAGSIGNALYSDTTNNLYVYQYCLVRGDCMEAFVNNKLGSYYTKTEIDTLIGDIETLLEAI